MNKKIACLIAATLAASTQSHAADIRINGFMSFGGGRTFNEGVSRDHLVISETGGSEQTSTYTADAATGGVYDDTWDFRADSNYGIQVTADLGNNLTATGQITGNGGEDFEAVVSWAYLSYEFNDNVTAMVGRQRMPLFFFSDFIDVAYTYHWIRPPTVSAAGEGDTIEGIKLRSTWTMGSWDGSGEIYYGGSKSEVSRETGDFTVRSFDLVGGVIKLNNEWLTLRASVLDSNTIISGNPVTAATGEGTKDNPITGTFYGLAGQMNFGNAFVVAEFTQNDNDENWLGFAEIGGLENTTGWYVSSGIRLGSFTPHITYGAQKTEYRTLPLANVATGEEVTFEGGYDQVTVGLRWDFHPSAAVKIEYSTQSDDSDNYYLNQAGGFGYGNRNELDVFAIAFDVIF